MALAGGPAVPAGLRGTRSVSDIFQRSRRGSTPRTAQQAVGALRQYCSSPPAFCWWSRSAAGAPTNGSEAKKAAEAGAAFEAAVALANEGKNKEAEEAFAKIAAERHRRATACSPSSAKRPSSRAATPRPRSRSTISLPPTAASDACCRISPRCAPALILVDTAPYGDIGQRLEPLTAPDRAFRHSARSTLALVGLARQRRDRDAALVRHDPGRSPRRRPARAARSRCCWRCPTPTRRAEARRCAHSPDCPDRLAACARA